MRRTEQRFLLQRSNQRAEHGVGRPPPSFCLHLPYRTSWFHVLSVYKKVSDSTFHLWIQLPARNWSGFNILVTCPLTSPTTDIGRSAPFNIPKHLLLNRSLESVMLFGHFFVPCVGDTTVHAVISSLGQARLGFSRCSFERLTHLSIALCSIYDRHEEWMRNVSGRYRLRQVNSKTQGLGWKCTRQDCSLRWGITLCPGSGTHTRQTFLIYVFDNW